MFAKRIGDYLEEARHQAPLRQAGSSSRRRTSRWRCARNTERKSGRLVADEVAKDLSWLSKHGTEG